MRAPRTHHARAAMHHPAARALSESPPHQASHPTPPRVCRQGEDGPRRPRAGRWRRGGDEQAVPLAAEVGGGNCDGCGRGGRVRNARAPRTHHATSVRWSVHSVPSRAIAQHTPRPPCTHPPAPPGPARPRPHVPLMTSPHDASISCTQAPSATPLLSHALSSNCQLHQQRASQRPRNRRLLRPQRRARCERRWSR